MSKPDLLLLILAGIFVASAFLVPMSVAPEPTVSSPPSPQVRASPAIPLFSSRSEVLLFSPPEKKILADGTHVFQTFNNCGPAALSMALTYYGFSITQQQLGQELRPFQNPKGDNDDKSVTLEELAEKAEEYGLVPFHRPGGSVEIIKQFITYDIPVVARTLTKPTEDIGHYRVVKGYDTASGQLFQDDSLQGKNLTFTFTDFNVLWQRFNFEYVVLVPPEKENIALAILKEETDPLFA